jgi:regulator of sigma E protease
MNLLQTIAAFVVALGSLILIHELGHYLVARAAGVKVLRFSIGFGRPIISRRFGRDDTEWVLAIIPLGGYVKMVDEREGTVDPADLPRAFNRQPVSRRFAIVVAGPVANFLLAILVYWVLFTGGMPGMRPIIGEPAVSTPAAAAGFTEGETILKVGTESVTTWQDARWALLQHAVDRARVKVELRSESGAVEIRTLDLTGITSAELDADVLKAVGLGRFSPPIAAVIGQVVKGSPAERSGLAVGDQILGIGGEDVRDWQEVVSVVRKNPGQRLEFELRRAGGQDERLAIVPEEFKEGSAVVGRIGAAPRIDSEALKALMVEVRYPPGESLWRAVAKTWETSVFSLQMLGKMLTGHISLKNLSGPITIADYAGQSAQVGWVAYLSFIALISISLGVLNLLPVPLLDGGHLMYYIVEILKGSPVSERAMQIGQQVGMALLFTLMLLALYNDVNRLFSN